MKNIIKPTKNHLEVLPAYWGIETFVSPYDCMMSEGKNLEVLPAYWGIETLSTNPLKNYPQEQAQFGSTTRLLGY